MKQTPYDKDGLTSVIFSTKAVSIWNNQKGPVFWYAAGVPGPFYVNTEKLIGAESAEKLLASISKIVAMEVSAEEKSSMVETVVMNEYAANETFQKIIATMVHDCRTQFGDKYNTISGGERRDWFFSIPFAIESGLDHIYLFKNGGIHIKPHNNDGQKSEDTKILHVADLINNAASYFNSWIPILEKHGLSMMGTACVITRGSAGTDKLCDIGIPVCSLKTIDKSYFDELHTISLIDKDTTEEIGNYFDCKENWARRYILSKPDLLGNETLDAKSKERLKSFLENDPWNLRTNDNAFFETLIATLK